MNQAETLTYILISVTLNSIAQILWKKGVKIDKINVKAIIKMMLKPKIITGLAVYAVSALLWILILSNTELSYAYPFIALGYILVAILSHYILREKISSKKIIGMTIIITGVILVGLSL